MRDSSDQTTIHPRTDRWPFVNIYRNFGAGVARYGVSRLEAGLASWVRGEELFFDRAGEVLTGSYRPTTKPLSRVREIQKGDQQYHAVFAAMRQVPTLPGE